MSLLDNFPHECSIFRRGFTKASAGGNKPANTTVDTEVPCWEQPLNSRLVKDYQKEGMDIPKKVYFLTDPGITPRYRIVITKRNGVAVAAANQVELKPLGTPLPDTTAGLEIMYKVLCTEMTSKE